MDLRDVISANLPSPRDDEPDGLRGDILDELADHLACAYNRELLRGVPPEEARRRAIERFGDPSAVARRLWFDAMRGRIMTQRVLIGTCLVVVVTCFGLAGFVWIQSNRAAAQAAVADRRLAEMLGQNRASNEAMLRQLQAMADSLRSSKASVWVPIRFRLTLEKPDGPPAVGYRVLLGHGRGASSQSDAMLRDTDESGIADFGVVQPGDWECQVRADPWHLTQNLNVLPDQPVDRQIVCPIQGKAPVQVGVRWPLPLRDKNLHLYAEFRHPDVQFDPSSLWVSTLGNPVPFWISEQDRSLDFYPNLQLVTHDPDKALRKGDDPIAKGRVLAHIRPGTGYRVPDKKPLDLWAGQYVLERLMLFRAVNSPEPGEGKDELLVLLSLMDREGGQETPNQLYNWTGSQAIVQTGRFPIRAERFPDSFVKELDHFQVHPGEATEWIILIPEEMARAAGERSEKFLEAVEKRLGVQRIPGKAG